MGKKCLKVEVIRYYATFQIPGLNTLYNILRLQNTKHTLESR